MQINQRVGMFKSIMLWEKFGLANQDGGFLSWNPEHDGEIWWDGTGYFNEIYTQEGQGLLDIIQELQTLVTEDQRLKAEDCFPPTEKHVQRLVDILENDSKERSEAFSREKRAEFIQKATQCCRNIKRMRDLVEKCYHAYGYTNIKMPEFPLPLKYCSTFFEVSSHNIRQEWSIWINARARELEEESKKQKEHESLLSGNEYERYRNYKSLVLRKVSPAEILQLQEGFNSKDLVKAYKKAVLCVHSDKAPAEFRTQADIIFISISEAYQRLSDQLTTQTLPQPERRR